MKLSSGLCQGFDLLPPFQHFHQVSVSVSPPRTELWPVSLQKAQSYWDTQKFLVSHIPQLTLVIPGFLHYTPTLVQACRAKGMCALGLSGTLRLLSKVEPKGLHIQGDTPLVWTH